MKASELIVGETYEIKARKHLKQKGGYYYKTYSAKPFSTTGQYLGPHKNKPQMYRFQDPEGEVVYAHASSIKEYVEVVPVDPDLLAELRERGVNGKTRSEDFAEVQQLLSGFGIFTKVDDAKTGLTIGYMELMKLKVLIGQMYATQLD